MSEATKNRIAAVIEELNYQPNGLARSLKQNRTFMVGVIVANIDYSLSIQCIRAIENELQRHGIQVIICNADENADKENTYVETLVARHMDGLIIFPTGDNPSAYTRLIEAHYPLVFMDRLVEGVTTQSLLLDNEMAVKTAVKELVRHGHEAIALLSLPLGEHAITPRRERMSGFRKAMEDAGLALNEQYMRSVPRDEIASAWMRCSLCRSRRQRCLQPMTLCLGKFSSTPTATPLPFPAGCPSSALTMPSLHGFITRISRPSGSRPMRWGCRQPKSCCL